MSEPLISWAIIQFRPNAHKLAQSNLNRQNIETFLPLQKSSKYKNGKSISTHRPLFPGYMFIAVKKKQMPWHKINSTFGVSKVLTLNGQPYLVPHLLISNIMRLYNEQEEFLSPKQFKKGENVQILGGPFDNFLATIDSINKNERIWVLINLMGRSTRALVDTEKIKSLIKA